MAKVKRVFLDTGKEVRIYGYPQANQFERLIKSSNENKMRFLLPCEEVITRLEEYDEETREKEQARGEVEFGFISGSLWVVDAWDLTHRQMVKEIPDLLELTMESLLSGVIFLHDKGYVICFSSSQHQASTEIVRGSRSMKTALSKKDTWVVPMHAQITEEESFEPLTWKERFN